MFISFFYALRRAEIPISASSLMRLELALAKGLASSNLLTFYRLARAVLIKHERYFDRFDQVFSHHFVGIDLPEQAIVDQLSSELLSWLKDPHLRQLLGDLSEDLPLDELRRRFEERLREQTERHDGGNHWIGTGGTSPFGAFGRHPSGIRVGGRSFGRSATQVAGERRYYNYAEHSGISTHEIGEALSKLKHLAEVSPKDRLDLDHTIAETCRQGGEISPIFSRSKRDRLRLALFIDNGGWSMDTHIDLVAKLFQSARRTFRELREFYFHNCIYQTVWSDSARRQPVPVDSLLAWDKSWRIVILGDALMAPSELESSAGAISYSDLNAEPGRVWIERLTRHFEKVAWLNPLPKRSWNAYTIQSINRIVPMFELNLVGIDQMVVALS